MISPASTSNNFAECVAEGIQSSLQPFDDFGMQVNVAVFWVGNSDLHATAHLDRLPVINRTLSVRNLSIGHATKAFLTDELTKLTMLYEMIGADPRALKPDHLAGSQPDLRLVD